jgi:tetratricopeptide (TPR) repeat protein
MDDLRGLVARAFAAQERGDVDAAERACREAIAADPAQFDTHHLLATIIAGRGRHREALANYTQALALRPDAAAALYNCSLTLEALGRFDEALVNLNRALAVEPGFAEALSNRSNVFFALDRLEEALASSDAALAIEPASASALTNRGIALVALDRLDDALASFDRALALQPDFAACRLNRAFLLLMLGRFAEGWREYEWRRQQPSWSERKFPAPEWRGEDLTGKRLLLHAEQALGNTISFARFAPLLARRGASVVLNAQRPLATLLRSLDDVAVAADGDPLPPVDFHLPLMSVPFVLALDEAQIPAAVPYLRADPARVAAWSKRLPGDGFRVGICWQGDPRRAIDRGRSIPLRAFAPLARVPGVRLLSLQQRDGLEQLAELPAGIRVEQLGDDFDAGPDAFLDCAAVMTQLDLVVTCDTSIAQLAGALARPVWVALRDVPVDWRWMLERDDSPWLPTARLFRQRRRGDWPEVFERISNELAALVAREPV